MGPAAAFLALAAASLFDFRSAVKASKYLNTFPSPGIRCLMSLSGPGAAGHSIWNKMGNWHMGSLALTVHTGTGVATLQWDWDGSSCADGGMGSRWDGSGAISVM